MLALGVWAWGAVQAEGRRGGARRGASGESGASGVRRARRTGAAAALCAAQLRVRPGSHALTPALPRSTPRRRCADDDDFEVDLPPLPGAQQADEEKDGLKWQGEDDAQQEEAPANK